jgi:hypothetical protein
LNYASGLDFSRISGLSRLTPFSILARLLRFVLHAAVIPAREFQLGRFWYFAGRLSVDYSRGRVSGLTPALRRYENRSTIMTSNRPLEEWGKLLGDVPAAGATLDRFLHHAQTIAITGRSYRIKDHTAIAGKENKNKKAKSKPHEPSTAEPAS